MSKKDNQRRIDRRNQEEAFRSQDQEDSYDKGGGESSTELEDKLAEFEGELREVNGTHFVWNGEPEKSDGENAIKKGFVLAGEKEFIEKYEGFDVLKLFDISDVSALEPGDSRSLVIKYPSKTDKRRLLHKGELYFLNLKKE